jgi:hypothetical protein
MEIGTTDLIPGSGRRGQRVPRTGRSALPRTPGALLPHPLKRARATVDNYLADSGSNRPSCQPDTASEHQLVARLTDAIEQAEPEALAGLLVADVRLSKPLEYRGVAVARRVFTAATFPPDRSCWVVPTRANGQPALGMYRLPVRQQRERRWSPRPARPGCARRSRLVSAHCSARTTRLASWAQRGSALPRLANAVARLPTGSEPGTRDRSAHPKALRSG